MINKEKAIEKIKNRIFEISQREYEIDLIMCNVISGKREKELKEESKTLYVEKIERLQDYETFCYDPKEEWEESLNFTDYDS